jgi:hypothetical protein
MLRVLAVLLMLCGSAHSEEGGPREGKDKATQTNNQHSQAAQQSAAPTSLPAPPIINVYTAKHAGEESHCAKPKDWKEWPAFSWCKADAWLDAERIIAIFTVILAGSTIGLWISTRKLWLSAKASEVALKTLERPYVVIDPRTNHADVLAHLEVHLVNHGRSLAFVGIAQGDFYIQDEPPRQFLPLKKHERGVHWVLPGHGKGKIVQWPSRKTADEIERVRAGTDKLYFLAVISYRDAAGNWYDTGACVVYDPETKGTSAAGGPEHNFMT